MASIQKIGKYYKLIDYIGGKQKKKSLKTSSKTIATAALVKYVNDKAKRQLDIELYFNDNKIKLSEFISEALEYSSINKSKKTCIMDKYVLNKFLNVCGDMPLNKITVRIIEKYKAFLHGKGLAPNSINLELRHLSSAFTLACNYDYIIKNPFKSVKKVVTPKKLPKYLSPVQASRLLDSTKGYSIYGYILFALSTGGRCHELANLTWDQIDFGSRKIKFFGKGAKERIIPISENLYEYLISLQHNKGFVIPGARTVNSISRQFRNAARKIGLKDITFHNLRDTFASWLVQNNYSLLVVKELLGHEDIKTTLIYAHLTPNNHIDAIMSIDNILLHK